MTQQKETKKKSKGKLQRKIGKEGKEGGKSYIRLELLGLIQGILRNWENGETQQTTDKYTKQQQNTGPT